MDEAPRLWSTDELAEVVNLTPRWIRRMCATGQIQATRVGRDWVIANEEAQRVIEEKTQEVIKK